ncbi:Heterokaryon incompatibility protein (HET) domain containing protein [Elaphomyces granulatus]
MASSMESRLLEETVIDSDAESIPSSNSRTEYNSLFNELQERRQSPPCPCLQYKDRRLHDRADCTANFTLMRDWLKECEENHPSCQTPLTSSDQNPYIFLPTRLIDVSPEEPQAEAPQFRYNLRCCAIKDEPQVRLVKGVDLKDAPDRRYITVSHCWGKRLNRVPRTTKAKLDQHEQGIQWRTLSNTFQDAIVTTRQFGVRYLWIDSLCIVQNSKEEVSNEISKMHLVYSQAYCMLSAQDSFDGRGGLFIRRNLKETLYAYANY